MVSDVVGEVNNSIRSPKGLLPRAMSTMVPVKYRTMWWRNRLAVISKESPKSFQGNHLASFIRQ